MIKSKYKARAIDIAKQQGGLGNSPVEINESGEVKLCAAACLAYAGIELNDGESHAAHFSLKLAISNDKKMVSDVFDKFGWGRNFCKSIMVDNDNSIRSQRIKSFVNKID